MTVAAQELLGPSEGISSSCQKNPGPIRGYRQQLPEDLWAQARPLAAAAQRSLGPSDTIGSSCPKVTGPIQGYWQQLPKKFWAHMRSSAAAAERSLGPSKTIGSSCPKICGPKQNHQQQLPQSYWAHPRSLAAAAEKILGPSEVINSSCRKISGPKRDYRHHWQHHLQEIFWAHSRLSATSYWIMTVGPLLIFVHWCSMGPCGFYRDNRSICTWVFTYTSYIFCNIMCLLCVAQVPCGKEASDLALPQFTLHVC